MKKILFSLLFLITSSAFAQQTNSQVISYLVGIGVSPELAQEIGDISTGKVYYNQSLLPATDATYNLGSSTKSWSNIYGNIIQFTASSGKIFGGSANTDFRNNANSQDNLVIADAGNVTIGSGSLSVAGNMTLTGVGKTYALSETTPASACRGVATPNGTTPVTVTTSCATTGARVFFEREGAVTNMGTVSTTTAPNNTSFAFASTGASDTLASSVIWYIQH